MYKNKTYKGDEESLLKGNEYGSFTPLRLLYITPQSVYRNTCDNQI